MKLETFPAEILEEISSYLSTQDIKAFSSTSSSIRDCVGRWLFHSVAIRGKDLTYLNKRLERFCSLPGVSEHLQWIRALAITSSNSDWISRDRRIRSGIPDVLTMVPNLRSCTILITGKQFGSFKIKRLCRDLEALPIFQHIHSFETDLSPNAMLSLMRKFIPQNITSVNIQKGRIEDINVVWPFVARHFSNVRHLRLRLWDPVCDCKKDLLDPLKSLVQTSQAPDDGIEFADFFPNLESLAIAECPEMVTVRGSNIFDNFNLAFDPIPTIYRAFLQCLWGLPYLRRVAIGMSMEPGRRIFEHDRDTLTAKSYNHNYRAFIQQAFEDIPHLDEFIIMEMGDNADHRYWIHQGLAASDEYVDFPEYNIRLSDPMKFANRVLD